MSVGGLAAPVLGVIAVLTLMPVVCTAAGIRMREPQPASPAIGITAVVSSMASRRSPVPGAVGWQARAHDEGGHVVAALCGRDVGVAVRNVCAEVGQVAGV